MTRTGINFWLDVLMLVIMIGMAMTGGLMHFVLPPGTGHSLQVFGLGRHDYGQIHVYLALAALALLAIHVVLHWSWICCVVSKGIGKENPSARIRVVWGLLLLAGITSLMVGGIWWASGKVESNFSRPRHRQGLGFQHDSVPTAAPIVMRETIE